MVTCSNRFYFINKKKTESVYNDLRYQVFFRSTRIAQNRSYATMPAI